MIKRTSKTVDLVSPGSDVPNIKRGSLIPPVRVAPRPTPAASAAAPLLLRAVAWFLVLLVGGLISIVGYGFADRAGQVATPVLTVINPDTLSVSTLGYGPLVALQANDFYTETRDALISAEKSFIEIDLKAQQVRYFETGILYYSTPVEFFGTEKTWWGASTGLYQVTVVEDSFFSTVTEMNFPYVVKFADNFMIHGAPTYADGSPVPESIRQGSVLLKTEAAAALAAVARVGLPVLVQAPQVKVDNFVYEPPAPSISADSYIVADIDSGTVLAADGITREASIASITKLMTALVAVDNLSIEEKIKVTQKPDIISVVPRLGNQSEVSVYKLLQLLLVESSNEAAEVIAGELGRDDFVVAMNEMAALIGLKQTKFTDPSGLSAENKSTAGDLFRLAQYMRQYKPFLYTITRDTKSISFDDGGLVNNLNNFNETEGLSGFVGGKVGETNAAGQTALLLYDLDINGTTRTVAIIILGSTTRKADVSDLIEFVEEQFSG